MIKPEHFDRFCDFSRQLIDTLDIDPQYYLIKEICDIRDLSPLDRYDFCVIFYGFNHVGSCDRFFKDRSLDVSKLSYGKNRRGFRGNKKVLNFIDQGLAMRSIVFDFSKREDSWSAIYRALREIKGCGPWSGYCLTEVLKIVLGFDMRASDFGDLDSSTKGTGPLGALEVMTDIPVDTWKKDKELHREVFDQTLSQVSWRGMEEMESALCNYLSLLKGNYYVGRDIDRQIPALKNASSDWWEARKRIFPQSMLGEIGGWDGPRKELMGKFEAGKRWR